MLGKISLEEHFAMPETVEASKGSLPAGIWRADNCNACAITKHGYPAKKKLAEYFLANFFITTSGNFRTQTLIGAMLEVGADRIMFAAD